MHYMMLWRLMWNTRWTARA